MAMFMLLIPPFLHPILGSKLCRPSLSVGSNAKETIFLEELPNKNPMTILKDNDNNHHQDVAYQPMHPPLVKALKAKIDQNPATFQFP
ncbi:hypothetical protein KSS87_020721, partial [Heliosperma pusillum]